MTMINKATLVYLETVNSGIAIEIWMNQVSVFFKVRLEKSEWNFKWQALLYLYKIHISDFYSHMKKKELITYF